jgi:CelD/BcsL family acetyltransferase involved in cellulose biosynthesis
MSDYQAEWVTDEARLAALSPEWDQLWRASPDATPFQSPAWLASWWEVFAPGRLALLAVRKHGCLAGLAPLYLENGLNEPRLLPLGTPITDYLDVLLHPAHEKGAALAISGALGAADGWASIELDELPEASRALLLPCPVFCADSIETSTVCPYLPLPQGLAGLKDILPPRKRRSIRMVANRASHRGAVRVLSLADRSVSEMLADLFRLHGQRWQTRGENGVLASDEVQRFHRLAAPRLSAAGLLRCYAMKIEDQVAGLYYGFLSNGQAYGYLTGFDPAFAYESPGTLVVAHAIEAAIGERAREFHFLRGGEEYKYGWGARDRWNIRRRFTRRAAGRIAPSVAFS